MKSISKRRGDSASPAARLLAGRWQTHRAYRARCCIGLVLLLFLNLYVWWTPSSSSGATVSRQQQHPRVVVCLSTIPSRIHLLQPTLDSLYFQQTKKADLVYVTLPRKQLHGNTPLKYTIPRFMKRYQRQGWLRILTPEWDYGPISKVFFVLREEPPDACVIYVDDDWIYPDTLVQGLHDKSRQYQDYALAWSGALLRNYFRQVGHSELHKNRHPILFMQVSGTPTFFGERPVDVIQGAFGVLVKPRFFSLDELERLLNEPTLALGVIKSDDFILSAHLESHNVTRLLVEGGSIPTLRPEASSIDKLSLYMYNNAMEAAYVLQQRLGIWQHYRFLDPTQLSKQQHDAIHCENGRGHCFDGWKQVLRDLDDKYPPNSSNDTKTR